DGPRRARARSRWSARGPAVVAALVARLQRASRKPLGQVPLGDTRRVPGPNFELVERMFAAFAERDLEAMVELVDPELEFLPVSANLTTGGVPYRGRDGLARYFEDVAKVWPELRLFPEEYRA